MQFLLLVLFSQDEHYDSMYELMSSYYNKFKNVKTIYYTYSNTIEDDFVLKNNILYIQGTESYIPGILDKTIKAFKYFEYEMKSKNVNYDYIIRSNISTIIRFDKLESALLSCPVEYGGGLMYKLGWLSEHEGIIDERFMGTYFCSGTCILFSKPTFLKMMLNIHHIRMDIIDDVSIGILFNENAGLLLKNPSIKSLNLTGEEFLHVPNMMDNIDELNTFLINNKNAIFYRNKNDDRFTDVTQMKYIISFLNNN